MASSVTLRPAHMEDGDYFEIFGAETFCGTRHIPGPNGPRVLNLSWSRSALLLTRITCSQKELSLAPQYDRNHAATERENTHPDDRHEITPRFPHGVHSDSARAPCPRSDYCSPHKGIGSSRIRHRLIPKPPFPVITCFSRYESRL